jgi:DNA-binding phage protein
MIPKSCRLFGQDHAQIQRESRACRFNLIERRLPKTPSKRSSNVFARDPEFARALLDEAATLFLNGEPDTARLILRDLVDATVGFEGLAVETAKPAKSLHRMLSKTGNPTMDNVAAILAVVRKKLRVDIRAHSVAAA